MMSTTCYLALGSNLGERHALLAQCRALIRAKIGEEVGASDLYETEPVGYESRHMFLNMVVAVSTELTPQQLLLATQQIEQELGRERKSREGMHFDRTCDVDIILYGDLILQSPKLEIPHPRFRERAFVLDPLCEIAPQVVDPVTKLTIQELTKKWVG